MGTCRAWEKRKLMEPPVDLKPEGRKAARASARTELSGPFVPQAATLRPTVLETEAVSEATRKVYQESMGFFVEFLQAHNSPSHRLLIKDMAKT